MFKLLNRGIMKRILVTLIIFEILLMSYVNIFVYPKIQNANREFAESSLNKLIKEKRIGLEYLFNQVESEVENLGLWVEEFLDKEITQEDLNNFNENYYVNENNIFTNKAKSENMDRTISNIFLSYKGKLSQKEISDIINTSKMELQFQKCTERIPYAEWVYFISSNNMIRMYPAYPDNVNKFGFDHNFQDDVYYYIANEANNPERKPVWTNPYIDYLGKGLVITCSYPIYKNNKMIGIVSIDVGLDEIRNSISDLSIQGTGISFLIDEKGKIIYFPGYEIEKSEKGSVIKDSIDIYASNEKEKQIFKQMLDEKQGIRKYYIDGGEKQLIYDNISGLNWILGIQVDSKAYFKNNIIVNENIWDLVFFSAFLILILLLYYYYSLSRPIFNLVDEIHELGSKYIDDFELYENSDEIKILDTTFKNLKSELDEYIEKLYYKNNEFQTIFDNMPGMLYIIDTNYNLKMFNNNSEKLIIENESSLKNKKCYELMSNRHGVCTGCPVQNCLNHNQEYTMEVQNNDRIYDVSSFPIKDSFGLIREIIVFSIDKTDEIIKNLELANAEKFAMIGQVSASVTHQLKNNISVIKGACYLLNEIESENNFDIKEVREVLCDLNESIKEAESTIYSLIDFNRNGNEVSCVNIIGIIEQILIIEKNDLYKNSIRVCKEYEDNEIIINTGENSLKFIFTNLIRNAIEVMKDEGGCLTIKAYKNNNYIHIEVIDSGKGIDEAIKGKIFEPYYTTKENGSGLGLWIAKEQVKKLNGYIYCESKKGKGTSFTIVLPIK